MKEYDVIIVGAGPAGGNLARRLSEKGVKILVFDKEKELGEPIYSTAITPKDTFEKFGLDKNLAHRALNSWVLYGPTKKAKFNFGEIQGYTLNLRKFKQELIKTAIKNGVEILVDTTVTEPVIEAGKIIGVKFKGPEGTGEAFGKIIVDASGHEGVLATSLKLRERKLPRLLIGLEYLMENLDLPDDGRTLELYFGYKYLPAGYGWIAPTGPKEAKVGVGVISDFVKDLNIQKVQDDFISKINHIAKGQSIEIHSGILFANGGIKNHVKDNFIVLGDAAAQANPLVGEGIRHALQSAEFAAETIEEAFEKLDFSAKTLNSYNLKWADYIKGKWGLAARLRDIVTKIRDKDIDNFVEDFAKIDPQEALRIMRGDFSLKDIIKFAPSTFKSLI